MRTYFVSYVYHKQDADLVFGSAGVVCDQICRIEQIRKIERDLETKFEKSPNSISVISYQHMDTISKI
jgi:hypothetical protein